MSNDANQSFQVEHKKTRRQRKTVWQFSPTEITTILGISVVAVWTTMFFVVFLRQPILGGDFMQFFTFGAAAREGAWAMQYDWSAFHALQVSLVPASDAVFYAPTYPPLVPALYAPLSLLRFPVAFAAWVGVVGGLYCGLVSLAAKSCGRFSIKHVVLASLLFPPFVAHMVIGQSTIWPLAGFVLGSWALLRSRPVVAGVAFSLVAIKPHLGMALAVVVLGMRLWPIVRGLCAGVALQAALTLAFCGNDAVTAYWNATIRVLRDTRLIEPQDERFTHALRMALESHLSHSVATGLWLAASGLFGWMAIRAWRRHEDWAVRMSALLLATLLISPHVQAYDAILLAPATLWIVCWAARTGQATLTVGVVTLSVAFVVPSARLWGIPVTLPLMTWLLWRCQVGTSSPVFARSDPAGR